MSVYTTIDLKEATMQRRGGIESGTNIQSPKTERACDFCRRRKTKCDGGRTQAEKCSNCYRNKVACTYLEPSKPRGPPKLYVNALEDRIERFELLLKRLRPDTDFTDEIGTPIPRGSWRKDGSKVQKNNKNSNQAGPSSRRSYPSRLINNNPFSPPFYNNRSQSCTQSDNESVFSSDEEEEISSGVLKRLTEYPTFPGSSDTSSVAYESDLSMRFHGKSSFFPLLRVTRDFKKNFSLYDDDHHDYPSPHNSDRSSDSTRSDFAPSTRRDFYWKVPPWEHAWEQSRSMQTFCNSLCPPGPSSQSESNRRHRCHAFPPQDLTLSLIALYFTHLNSQFPLLHKPLFYDQFNSNLHLQDTRFAATVWCIIANASRWSDDPRVLWTGWGSDDTIKDKKMECQNLWLSAGWRFFTRGMDAFSHTQSIINPPHLFDVQTCSLAAMFLRCSTYPSNSWVVNGIGIRKAQDIGVHRKKVYNTKPNIDDELWKRAFWVLVSFDRIDSVLIGRPCCIPEEDFDLDLPLAVDDEYWIPVDPLRPPFVQPEGKPSYMSFFVHFCKLTQIFAYATRTIYCIEKSTTIFDLVGSRWKEKVVTQLNTALNEWVDAIPKHLRWATKMDNEVFSNQSAVLYTCYYLCIILIYCPFISSPASSSSSNDQQPSTPEKRTAPSNNPPYPALAICVNAAQSAVRTFEAQLRRGLSNIPNMLHAAQICTPILLLGVWDAKAKIDDEDPNDEEYSSSRRRAYERILSDIRKCINALEISETRWGMARTVLEMLKEALPETRQESKSNDTTGGNTWDEQRHPTSFDRSSAPRTYETQSQILPTDVLPPPQSQSDRDAYVLHESLPIRMSTSGHYMGARDSPFAQMSSFDQMLSPNKFQRYTLPPPLHVSAGTLNRNDYDFDHDGQKSHSSGSAGSVTPDLSTSQTIHLLPYAPDATHSNSHEQSSSRQFLPISHTRRNPIMNETLPPPSQILSDVNLWRRTDGSALSDLGQQQSTSYTSYVRGTDNDNTQFSRMDEKRLYQSMHRSGQTAPAYTSLHPHCYDADPPLG